MWKAVARRVAGKGWWKALVLVVLLLAGGVSWSEASPPEGGRADGVTRIRLLPPSPDNPRNSEGDFIQLHDGRILLVYTHFTGGGSDHSSGYLAGRFSSDGGRTWSTEDVTVVANEGGFNVMSVSLLRLASGEIALFYLRKNSLSDCRPVMRLSTDEAKSWSPPTECITGQVAYYVVNNDRVVQLSSGRLVIPASLHQGLDGQFTSRGKALCYLSDDKGQTWRRSTTVLQLNQAPQSRSGLQEPGIVQLKDGSLLMFCRTDQGRQYTSHSTDGGETWSPVEPSNIFSPVSPATIERIPKTGHLLLVWNDHRDIPAELRGKRTPLSAAVSTDEGKTWQPAKTLEDDPGGWYCYTAVDFAGDRVLLAHCAGRRATGGLNLTQVTLFDVDWLYK